MDLRESPANAPPQSHLQPPPPPPGMTLGQPHSYAPNTNNAQTNASPSMINPNSTASMMQNSQFAFNSMVSPSSKPMEDSLNSQYGDGSQTSGLRPYGFGTDTAKKKRGRPRKYSPDGNIALGLTPNPAQNQTPNPVTPNSSSAPGPGDFGAITPASDPSAKRRGRPPGSGKKQLDALGSFGVGFTPHVILVKAGEDIASKIMAFSQEGPRTICILSANGAVCNVTLRQTSMSGGIVTYEGRFEIISLSGSFFMSESGGSRNRTGSLSVSLAGPDGRVLGGGVAGMLVAATPVQVIVGSFIADKKKPKSLSSSAPPHNMLNFNAPAAAASPSSESSEENGSSSFNRDPVPYNNASQPLHNMPMYSNMGWGNSTVKML
ncbi:AT-hook motif nuclear-localized protein 8-like isoform X2 [Diospyros lotus]|uniref:AT-hook motif nuclear-localized protein 8-like isoform X1 n=1 Tax=Diospyros lotus TaxID=55363 RepID=UPI002252C247|nr:AT-hook motif nuclear-localized protein 8-like isoform X1 [Diospyros lotus]XP_052209707.1 AT-hook motif nuclear-localized protein 8-like isoform X2 [Diospyros lotus]